MTKKIDQLLGLRWFERTNGNTYHSVKIWYDDNTSEVVPFSYGYDNQFVQTAVDWYNQTNYPNIKASDLWNNENVIITSRDVKLKRDLNKF